MYRHFIGKMKLSTNYFFINNSFKSLVGNLNVNKRFQCTKQLNQIKKEEIKIPVPWGHISGVRYGPTDKQPIIALHGWQDNAGTWTPLIPHLPSNISILAVDFPGHGHSSWYPAGTFYHPIDNVVIIKRIVNYFDMKKVSLLGHSMGAIASFMYSSVFPDEVDCAVLIDNLKPITFRPNNYMDRFTKDVHLSLKADKRNIEGQEPPSYSYDELIEKLYIGCDKSVNRDKCHYLLERGVSKSSITPDKFYFSRDSRLKTQYLLKPCLDDVKLMTKRIKCPMLNIKYQSSPYFEPKELYVEIVNLLQETNENFILHNLPGTHHGHLNNPDVVAPYITSFIQKYSENHT